MSRTKKDTIKKFSTRRGIPATFKAMRKRIRRRRANQALKTGEEIPRSRTEDHRNYW